MMPAGEIETTVSVRLRPATAGDRPFLLTLYASTREAELAPAPWDAEQKSAFLRMQFEAQARHYEAHFPHAQFSIIESDGESLGRLTVHRDEDEIRIVDLALLPAHRGRGIGGALIENLLTESRQTGRPVRLHVEQSNRALHFYERLGFQRAGGAGIYQLMEWLPHTSPVPC